MRADLASTDVLRLGAKLRSAREEKGLSLRRFADRLGISSSALSQVETGQSSPSVRVLWAIVSELGLSMDELFGTAAAGSDAEEVVQEKGSRLTLELDSGVRWERLTPHHNPEVDFVLATYPPGSSSSAGDRPVTHGGREFGLVLSGELELTVSGRIYRLGPGDSCSFDSQRPHRLANLGEEPAVTVWFVTGRRGG